MKIAARFVKHYAFSIILVASISFGACLGLIFKQDAAMFKPFGDIFLNLLFTAVVPLVFFSISSSVAGMSSQKTLGKILLWMILIFVATGIISAALMVVGVKLFPQAVAVNVHLSSKVDFSQAKAAEALVTAFTVSDFSNLLSKKNMLALIVFAMLVGLAASKTGKEGKLTTRFLSAGNQVMMKVISFIMFYAPVGLGAYFAYLIGVFGPELFGSYLKTVTLYYPLSILYFLIGFSFYAWFAGGSAGIQTFWTNILPPSLTAFGTGSSIATIPSNIQAADKIGVPKEISEIVIPIGATIHMDGTCLSAILKIALLYGLFGMKFAGVGTIAAAIGVALLSGIVMSGIPSGAFLGELLIVTLYGFPVEALPIISMLGTLVDPPATMVNAVGDNVASMMIARILGGKNWLRKAR